MTLLLGIDLGTSSVKAVLFEVDTARTVAVAGQEYPIHNPAPGRSEQNPEDWWQASAEVVRRILVEAGRSDVAAIGLDGQMHGATLLDRAGRPTHPAIIWADQRSAIESHDLVALFGAERYAAIAGTLPATGFTGPLLLWLKRHDPELLARSHRVIFPKDYVRFKLTGEIATDVSDAAASGIFDVVRGRWAEDIVDAAGLPGDLLPPLLESSAVAGELTAQAAEALGLPAGIPVVAGCADQPAQCIANGLIAPGGAVVMTGSGGQVVLPVRASADGRVPTDPRVHVFNHAVPQTWYVLGAILAAGLSLRWLRNLLGLQDRADAYALLSAEAAPIPPGADGLLYLPYLTGERTPHMDPLARGTFVGLSYHHTRGHLARAVMEGVTFALRQTLEISLGLAGAVTQIIVGGGGGEADLWRQIQADVFGRPLQRTLLAEKSAVGAALLAGVGASVYSGFEPACASVVRYGPLTEPDPSRQQQYDALYARYTMLYPRLRGDFHWLSDWAGQ